MIDIHSHLLPLVDDGSEKEEISLDLLRESVSQGVNAMILTPHLRGEYDLPPQTLREKFAEFKSKVESEGIPIKLYLGQEIYVGRKYKDLFRNGEILTMNDTKFVLIEFDFDKKQDVAETVYEIKTMGYIPIVAHIERYGYADLDCAYEVKENGGYIQVNSASIVGKHKRFYLRKIKKLFKNGLVDFVASDLHSTRQNATKDAYQYISKKFGEDVAEKVFKSNAQMILEG